MQARRRPRAFSCVEGARWNWVNTGWKRARPTCKASRELGTPGRYTGRSNSIEWRAPFPSQKHFLFVLSRISTFASFFLSFPFPSLPFPSLPFLSYSICPPFVRKISPDNDLPAIDPNRARLVVSLSFHFVANGTRARTSVLALVLHISSVTSGAQLTIRIDPPRFACHQPISILPTYLFQRISSTLEFRPDTRDDRFFPTSLLSSTLCLRLELTRCGRETRILVSERGGRWGKLFHVVRDRATLYMIYITYNYILYTCHTKKRY